MEKDYEDWYWNVALVMSKVGDGFAYSISEAYRTASKEDKERIRTVFPELWEEYGEILPMPDFPTKFEI